MATRTTPKTIELEADADPKKRVVKFSLEDEKQGTTGAIYIENAKVGKAEAIRVTVEFL